MMEWIEKLQLKPNKCGHEARVSGAAALPG
jgi:hypothetical protein